MLVDLIRQLLPAFRKKLFQFVIADRAWRLNALRKLRQVEIFLALDLDPAGMPADRDFLYFLCFRLRCIAFSFVELEHQLFVLGFSRDLLTPASEKHRFCVIEFSGQKIVFQLCSKDCFHKLFLVHVIELFSGELLCLHTKIVASFGEQKKS